MSVLNTQAGDLSYFDFLRAS